MRAIIIEDEKLSADFLIKLLAQVDSTIEVIETFDSVKKSISYFQTNNTADIIFVDIHLADGLSFDIFSRVQIDIPIIFTTAFDEYAIKAFKLNSIDYLLKPIGRAELKNALDKYKRTNSVKPSFHLEELANEYSTFSKQFKTRFMVKIGDNIISIKTEDIVHFIAEDGVVMLVTELKKRYPIDYTLDQLENLIDLNLFFRINRKVLITMNSIQKSVAYFNSRLKVKAVHLEEEVSIVSRDRVNDFKKWLDGGIGF
jgi:DNA-binding LytR/AlgR family response regulator